MARARIFTIIYIFIHWQASDGQQCSVTANHQQHIPQNNLVFNQQNPNQNFEPANFNAQLQQSARQPANPQQTLNSQQLSNIQAQTFNVQQPGNLQQQGGAQSVNQQPVNQALNLQQVPQHVNMKQEVPQQISPNSINLQQATAVPINSQVPPHVNIVQQQSLPAQGFNFQQSYAVNSQQPTHVQGVNFQQQTSSQPVSIQQPIVVQPVNMQQQITPQDQNLHQQPMHHTSNLHLQSAPIVANLQQAPSSPVLIQQSPIVQPLNYVDVFPIQNQNTLPLSPVLQSQNSQQIPRDQQEVQQQIPYNSLGGCQVVSYQKPCQQSEITPNLPVALQLSTQSTPTIIAAVPASLSNINAHKKSSDNIYVLTPQNYLNSASYSPIIVSENLQPSFSTPAIIPITTVPNTVSSSFTNYVRNNNNQLPETTEYWTSSLQLPDFGMLTGLQEQFPIASLLQSNSPIQSAVLSSILSSIQSPSTSASQYVISSNYPAQAILTPQSNSQSTKLSLKSLLPLLLDLIQEKYTNHGCQCNCCNCQCSTNHNNIPEPQPKEYLKEAEEKRTEISLKNKEESNELEEIVHARQRKKEDDNRNIIPDDSTDVEDTENSSYEDEDEDDEVAEASEENSDNTN